MKNVLYQSIDELIDRFTEEWPVPSIIVGTVLCVASLAGTVSTIIGIAAVSKTAIIIGALFILLPWVVIFAIDIKAVSWYLAVIDILGLAYLGYYCFWIFELDWDKVATLTGRPVVWFIVFIGVFEVVKNAGFLSTALRSYRQARLKQMPLQQAEIGLSKMDKLIDILKNKELEYVTKGFARTSYNASIARVLEEGGVGKFEELAWDRIRKLSRVVTMKDFDAFHESFVDKVMGTIKTNKGEKPSYGDAQKPVNVFLKEYVYRAKLPEQQLAERLTPYLHVPLDKNVMEFFYEKFTTEYKALVHPVIAQYQEYVKEKGYSLRLRDREFLNLAHIWSKGQYYAWQTLFRNLHPYCPVLLDMVYELKSRGIPIEL